MIDCDLSQKLVVVQNYYWEKSQTGIIIVGKIPERIKLVGTYPWYTLSSCNCIFKEGIFCLLERYQFQIAIHSVAHHTLPISFYESKKRFRLQLFKFFVASLSPFFFIFTTIIGYKKSRFMIKNVTLFDNFDSKLLNITSKIQVYYSLWN